jgi:aminomethyltransferase
MTDPIQSAASPLDTNAQLAALLRAAAVSPLDNIGWLRVTGADRVRWLNGMVTNSISQLADGQGCYNFALNAQGQIQFDLTAFVEPDAILLELSRDQIAQLHEHLDRYIIMDEVEIADVSAQRAGLLLIGPTASDVLHKINLQTPHHTPIRMQTMLHSAAVDEIIHAHSPLVPRYEIWSNPTATGKLLAELITAGATPVSAAALDQLRILEGTPRIGTDINDRTLAQETGQTHALHFTKGCYLGQEIVERIRSRGNVHRTLSGFLLTGALPAPGTLLEAESNSIGELTSLATIQLPDQPAPLQLALGIIRREAIERNLDLTYPGGTATPVTLPYTK